MRQGGSRWQFQRGARFLVLLVSYSPLARAGSKWTRAEFQGVLTSLLDVWAGLLRP